MAAGLDKHRPFSNTPAVEHILQNTGLMLAPGTPPIGWGHANAIWALMSNFIALDRLCATFGAATAAPGRPVARSHTDETIAIGITAEVSTSVPISTILSHFNNSSYAISRRLQKYSASSASHGLLVERLRRKLKQQPTPSIGCAILP